MTPFRCRLATTIVLGLLVTHAAMLVLDGEVWPFCSYAMYSWIQKREAEAFRMVGVPEGVGEREVRLDEAYLHPFNQIRLSEGLRAMRRASDGPRRIQEITRDALRRYEARRSAGLHDGPRLVAMRSYWTLFQIRPGAQNSEHPTERRLLAEARLPKKGFAP